MKWLRNLKLRVKIVAMFVLVLLATSGTTGALYYNYAFRDTLSNYYASSEDLTYQMGAYLTERFQSITRRLYAMRNNPTLYNAINQYMRGNRADSYAKLQGHVSDSISELQLGDRYIHSVAMFIQNEVFDNFTQTRRHSFNFENSIFYQYFADNPEQTKRWFPAMENPVFTGSETVIPVVYVLMVERQAAYVMVNLRQDTIQEYLTKNYTSFDRIFVVDQDGENVTNYTGEDAGITGHFGPADVQGAKAVCKQITLQSQPYLATYTVMPATGWQIFSVKSGASLVDNLVSVRNYIVIVLGISTVLGILCAVLFSYNVTSPLRKLVQIMQRATTNGFHVQFQYPYNDEIGNLAHSFNAMVREIEHLVAELNIKIEALRQEEQNVKLEQQNKRKVELQALQAQINPHFLYNTLNAIAWQAEDQGAQEISVMSNALGKFFRLSLSKGREIITIRDEIEHMLSYLAIQSIRYKSKLAYTVDVADAVKEYGIIKLVLQPLVENSLYHGLKPKEGMGLIRIGAQIREKNGEQRIVFTVEDNGEGIEPGKLAQINAGLETGGMKSGAGYGIFNVNERLRLFYGDSYGLRLESRYGAWTRAVLTIPQRPWEGG